MPISARKYISVISNKVSVVFLCLEIVVWLPLFHTCLEKFTETYFQGRHDREYDRQSGELSANGIGETEGGGNTHQESSCERANWAESICQVVKEESILVLVLQARFFVFFIEKVKACNIQQKSTACYGNRLVVVEREWADNLLWVLLNAIVIAIQALNGNVDSQSKKEQTVSKASQVFNVFYKPTFVVFILVYLFDVDHNEADYQRQNVTQHVASIAL